MTGSTLASLVRALGGDLYAGGYRGLVPAPGHSARDRSVSLLLRDGRVLAHTFGGADWREVLDDLRERGWIDAENRLLEGGAPAPPAAGAGVSLMRTERIAAAARLWSQGGPIAPGSPAALHAARRGVDLSLAGDALRGHSAAPAYAYDDQGPRRPALLAGVLDSNGALTGVEITYLDRWGHRSAGVRVPRKLIGARPPGSAVRLAEAAAPMLVAEGVFTTLSAMRRFRLPGWALLSTGNLRRWRPPPGVHHVLIAGDRGTDGERSASVLQAALSDAGVFAEVVLPPGGYGDWNDLDRTE